MYSVCPRQDRRPVNPCMGVLILCRPMWFLGTRIKGPCLVLHSTWSYGSTLTRPQEIPGLNQVRNVQEIRGYHKLR